MTFSSEDLIRLRPHHLFGCILVWNGSPAYDEKFDEKFTAVVTRFNQQPPVTIEIVEGPDDTCKVLSKVEPPSFRDFIYHCERPDIVVRDRIALAQMSAWLTKRQPNLDIELPLKTGQRFVVTPELLKAFREGFKAGATRAGCKGCVESACAANANQGFPRALLKLDHH